MSIWAPVVSVMRRIVLPPGPISRPIFSGSIWIVWMRGAYLLQVGAGRRHDGKHLAEDLDAGVAGLEDRGLCDLEGQAVDLKVELEPGDALGGARELEVHVAEVVLFADDVGDGDPFRDGAVRRRCRSSGRRRCLATGAMIGTPASISERQPPQIDAIEVEPFEAMISETTRIE